MPPVIPIIAAAAGAAASSIAGGALTGAIIGAVVTVGTGLAAQTLLNPGSPKQDATALRTALSAGFSNLQDRNTGVRDVLTSNIGSIPVVYGQFRVGGPIVYAGTAGTSNKFLFLAVPLCEGPIQSFDEIYIDGVERSSGRFESAIFGLEGKLGDDNQTPSTFMLSGPNYTSNHRFRGIATIFCDFAADAVAFPRIPVLQGLIKGRLVYDPRNSTTAYSNNPALCIRDYLTGRFINGKLAYGMGVPASEIDDASFIAAANYCDQSVSYNGVSMARYTLDGAILTDQTHTQNIKEMLSSCRGMLIFSGGKYSLKINKPETATFAFSEDNIIGGWSISRTGKRGKKNRVEAQYIDKSKLYETDIWAYTSDTYLASDNATESTLSLQFPLTTDRARVRALALMALRQTRLDTQVEFKATIAAMQVEAGDVVTITHATPGWVSKKFRIDRILLTGIDEVTINATEYDDAVYNLDNTTDTLTGSQSTLPSPFIINPPGVPSITQVFETDSGGYPVIKVTVSWTEPPDSPLVGNYESQYKLNSSSTWIALSKSFERSAVIKGLSPGLYDIRVRAFNTLGKGSDWAQASREILPDTTVPVDMTGIRANVNSGNIKLQWNQHPSSTVTGGGYIVIRHSPLTSGAAWNNIPSFEYRVSGDKIEATLPLLQGTYMIKAENYAGVQSVNYLSYVYVAVEQEPVLLAIRDNEAPSFSGAKTNMVATSGQLFLDGSGLFDSGVGNFDSAVGNFDDQGGFYTSGTYLHDATLDLGYVYFFRLKKNYTGTLSDLLNNFDVRTGLFDDQTGLFDGTNENNVTVKTYYRVTDADPATNPNYSAWTEYDNTEAKGRAIQLKLEVTTANTQQNIYIDTLYTDVLMNRRTTGLGDQVIAATGNTITYSKKFYQKPFINITIKDQQSGDYPVITAESISGFTLQIKNSSNVGVARLVDWSATGYGEETSSTSY